ncbi:peptidase T [Fibrobacter succinogenes subsp. succinogenes S85]|uniref:Peptidase T n=1 Tax=Fibrobacter succinogenes (strain ATCC 19169 / S85) TaxID=59374 RepID=C9RP58_FIBSS|nr:peptidase T [Fibrobacter succinogenes]ACX74522.1 peptidase T [Fibrobacter succinogenes subsp. succinogenes S85]ADL26486.1 peptidase T [Fibrobacter succinogenes subsp. succinogenes S85]
MKVQDRFLKYVSFTTTSDENSESCPSTKQQLELAKFLTEELEQIGLSQVKMDENGYVYGLLPATEGRESDTPIGFISHMDTSPDFSGVNPKPQIIEDYDGEDVLLKGSGAVLKVEDFPTLKWLKGRTLITTDGTTLLGADDKAGIAEIVTAMEELIEIDRHAESRGYENLSGHGDIWVCFTPDEEIGRGADRLDLSYFTAKYAYTVDGGYEGDIAYENFNAASATFKIHGKGVHPGEAKGIMKNASLMAAEIAMALPENETPATTEGREGFYHLTDMQGDVTEATLNYIVRDHDQTRFEERQEFLREIAKKFNEKFGEGSIELELKHSYSNMLQIIEKTPEVLERARTAIAAENITPVSDPVRGGTDGAKLSFMGLPCPNLGTGGYGYHGPFEHVTVEGMETVVRIIKRIATSRG